ncbi:MAG: methionyl-tRNA formyltransferase [Oscillospiraceae bacterium]|nr:methionyl-tRNA formyltransferase [Oscillospiraceae bacterium]
MKVVFMGTPDFARASLQKLLDEGHNISGVFTQPDRAKNRGMKITHSPVKELSMRYGLRFFQPEKMRDGTALEMLRSCKPDLIAVVAYGRILPAELLDLPPLGCVNLHASLLPELRGAAPIQWAIARGYTETGVTTMLMAPELDSGDILLYNKTLISEQDNAATLHDRLRDMGSVTLNDTLKKLQKGTISPIPQEHSKATYAPIIRRSDGKIDFTRPMQEINRFILGMCPWPGAFTENLKIHRAEPTGGVSEQPPGTVIQNTCVVCGDGRVLRLLEVQGPGGKRMPAEDYARGKSIQIIDER